MARRGRKRRIDSLGKYLLRGHVSDEGPIDATRRIIRSNWEKDSMHSPVVVIKEEPVSSWTTGESAMSKCAKNCSWAEQNAGSKTEIVFNKKVGDAVKYLLNNVPVEWQLLLIGGLVPDPKGEKEILLIVDYYIPKQVVGAAHVRNIDCIDKKLIEEKGIIATMHSHVNMGATFSSTDWESCNSSPIKYHVVINTRFEYEAVVQLPLACGMFRFKHVTIAFEGAQLPKPEGFENITQEVYSRDADWQSHWSTSKHVEAQYEFLG